MQGIYDPAPEKLLSGFCAQGDAGRAGGGGEILVLLEPGAEFSIARSGRTYGGAGTVYVRWTGSELISETYEERAARLGRTALESGAAGERL